jgi:glycosyltransferase involved in cell wall biosynthesis
MPGTSGDKSGIAGTPGAISHLEKLLAGSRRDFLKATVGFASLAALAACGDDGDDGITPPPGDDDETVSLGSGNIGVLNYAYALEQLEAAFYVAVLDDLFSDATADEEQLLTDLRDHEVAHRDFFAAALGEGEATGPDGAGRVPLASSGPLRLLFVGRLVERKGVEVLVRALPRLLEERDVRLTVVGEGEREASLRATARGVGMEDRIEFTGFVSREELSRRYASCDIFVLPAVVDRKGDTEGLGVVLLEALRHERPVVASRAGGIPDIVEDGRTGWLVPPGDPAALARRILDVAGRPDDARRVARRGREVVEARFGWERILEGLDATYREARETREARRSARRADGARGREDDAA